MYVSNTYRLLIFFKNPFHTFQRFVTAYMLLIPYYFVIKRPIHLLFTLFRRKLRYKNSNCSTSQSTNQDIVEETDRNRRLISTSAGVPKNITKACDAIRYVVKWWFLMYQLCQITHMNNVKCRFQLCYNLENSFFFFRSSTISFV